jgi:Flp pilus assembly pilin Flp
MLRCRQKFRADESGATMLEYAMLLLLIVLVVIAAAAVLGQNVLPLFQISTYLQ